MDTRAIEKFLGGNYKDVCVMSDLGPRSVGRNWPSVKFRRGRSIHHRVVSGGGMGGGGRIHDTHGIQGEARSEAR